MAKKSVKAAKRQDDMDRHARLMSWFRQEMQRQTANRYQMAQDEDYYDSLQHTTEESRELLDRGQMPVAWNEIKPTVDWLIGTERRARTDYRVVARNDDSDEADADAKVKTKLLKYLEDVGRVSFERSYAFNQAVKSGLGWIEVGVRSDPEQDPVYTRAESWRNILYDSLGPRRDMEDSRFIFRFRFVDIDVAESYFPDKIPQLRAVMTSRDEERYMNYWGGKPIDDYGPTDVTLPERWTYYDAAAWLNNPRQRVLLIEAWYKEPSTVTTGQGAGSYDRTYMRMRCTVMTEQDILVDDWSPYKHNRFPFVPIWCYRRSRDNAPYGVVRPLRGPQDAVNKSMSKSIWEISANQLVIEKGAIDPKVMNADQIREEAAAPDGFILLENGGLAKFKNITRDDRVNGHMQMVDRGIQTIRSVAGVTGENRGLETDSKSGKAIGLKQEQGSIVTAEIFDNMLLAQQMEGEITLSLVEQYFDQPKIFSISGERQKFEYDRVNTIDPQTGAVMNDITQRATQFVIGEQAWRQTIMQAAFESMMSLMGQIASMAPNVVTAMLATVLEMGDFPNKKQLVDDVRKATGQPDPDEPPDPQAQAEATQKQQMEQQTQQLAMQKLNNQVTLLQAQIAETTATGNKLDAEALSARLTAMYEAMQAAQVVATVPAVAPIADQLLRGSGYKDEQGQDPNIVTPQQGASPIPQPAAAVPSMTPPATQPLPPLQQADGIAHGIETQRPDGIR